MPKNNNLDKQEKDIDIIKNISKAKLEEVSIFLPNNKIGLTSKEADDYINNFGKNEISTKKNKIIKDVLKEIFSPFNLLLFFIAIFDFSRYLFEILPNKTLNDNSSEYLISSIIVFIMIILSTTVSLIIEYNTDSVNDTLQNLIKNNSNVVRDVKFNKNINKEQYTKIIKNITTIESNNLAIGDVLHLSTGDVLPSNVRILYEHHLLLNESSITGEPDNIHKEVNNDKLDSLSYKNICYAGSSVVSGFALGVIFQRLDNSYIGKISKKNQEKKTTNNSSLKITLRSITKIILLMVLITVLIVFFVNSVLNGAKEVDNWLNSLIFSIAIAVGLIPESLPVIISANLSRGSKNMANKKMLVKKASIVQDIGLIDILCTDKTGTLTNNEIILNDHLELTSINNNIDLINSNNVFKLGFYNSYFQTSLVNNSIDNAILKHKDLVNNINKIIKIDEIPFNFKRRILSIVIKNSTDNNMQLISKGAFEEILKISKYCLINEKVQIIDKQIKSEISKLIMKINNLGQRVIAIGYKKINNNNELFDFNDEKGLILCGFLTFSDTPKEGVEKAISLIKEYNVDLKIISGDNEKVTSAICSKIGLEVKNILTGNKLEQLNDDEKKEIINKTNIFVKISPNQKSEIIEVLQMDHKVGFLGDGINDAIALKQSDVAISVDNASEIAKASSDIILLEKNLKVIEDGLIQGRATYINITKFIKITLVNKLSLMFIFIITSFWFKSMILTPFQILLLDLLLDFVQMIFILDNVNLNSVKKIRTIKMKEYCIFSLFNAPMLLIIASINFIILKYGFNCQPNEIQNDPNTILFHTFVFTQMSLASILSIFLLRTKKNIFSNDDPIKYLIFGLLFIIISIILLLPLCPYVNNWLGFNILNSDKKWIKWWYLILLGLLWLYILIQEISKKIYIKIFKFW